MGSQHSLLPRDGTRDGVRAEPPAPEMGPRTGSGLSPLPRDGTVDGIRAGTRAGSHLPRGWGHSPPLHPTSPHLQRPQSPQRAALMTPSPASQGSWYWSLPLWQTPQSLTWDMEQPHRCKGVPVPAPEAKKCL